MERDGWIGVDEEGWMESCEWTTGGCITAAFGRVQIRAVGVWTRKGQGDVAP